MKIKNVKISGFRAFEKEENSIFDFTKGGETMNFVSIYSPNGFGKTAFYDAVEFGMTNKIQRFDRMVDFNNIRKENEPPIILNNKSKSGIINIETSSYNFSRVVRKVYSPSAKLENKYFQNQFLSQDLIDAFLKEEKAEDRYTKFLEIDNILQKYDAAYKKIIRLLEYIKDESKDLTKTRKEEEKKLQIEIDFEQEFKKFDELNELISELNKDSENLKQVDRSTFNQTSYDNLSRNIDVRLLSLEEQLTKVKLYYKTITVARDGETSENGKLDGGLFFYIDNKNKILTLDKQIEELNQIVKLFEEQEKVNNESMTNDNNLVTQKNKLDQALNIESRLETFIRIQKEIDLIKNEIADFKGKMLIAEREKFDAEKEINNRSSKLKELKNALENTQSKLNNLPAIQTQFNLNSKAIIDLQKTIDDLSKSIDTEDKNLKDKKIVLDEFLYYEDKINDDIHPLLEFKLFDEYKILVTNYLAEEGNLGRLIEGVQEIQFKIDNQTKFNKELTDFINSGLELANRSQSSNCPLCNQDYGTFEKLSESILSNELLDSQLKSHLEEKTKIEAKINKLLLQLSVDKEAIKIALSTIKQPYLSGYRDTQNVKDKLDSERKTNIEKLNLNQTILNDIKLLLGEDKTFEELSVKVHDELSKINNQITEISNQIKLYEDTLSEKKTFIQSTKEKLEISELNLLIHQSSNDYKEVLEFFNKELNSTFEKSILLEHISNIQLTITSLTGKKQSLYNSLEELKINLSNYTLYKDEYIQRKEQVTDSDL